MPATRTLWYSLCKLIVVHTCKKFDLTYNRDLLMLQIQDLNPKPLPEPVAQAFAAISYIGVALSLTFLTIFVINYLVIK